MLLKSLLDWLSPPPPKPARYPKSSSYKAVKIGTGTCLGCGNNMVGLRPDCEWWECVQCGLGGQGTTEAHEYLKRLASTGDTR